MRTGILTFFCFILLFKPLSLLAQNKLVVEDSFNTSELNTGNSALLVQQEEFLPVEQAYILNAEFQQAGQIRLNWQIADGYYLYHHGFEFKLSNNGETIVVKPQIPNGLKKQDEYFGMVEVYYNNIDILLDSIPNQDNLSLTVTSQGCADAGLCYPPHSQHFQVNGTQSTITPVTNQTETIDSQQKTNPLNSQPKSSLVYMLILAMMGGAILNLMPCVFPVLSLKVLGFAKDKNHSQVTHGVVYSAGVVISFVAVAAVLVSLQAAGAAIGWGFQLQSPWFVASLTYLFFIMGLSLSGYIELGSSWMNAGGGLAEKPGYVGSFFTGVLATVVASPCTAPFMGSALGFAVTQSTGIALLVFAALGFGMALPVLILSCSPKLLNKLPKPGIWMEHLKEFLAFPLYATAVWLCWVVGNQTGVNGMAGLLLGCILIALAVWLWRGKLIKRILAVSCATLAILIVFGPLLTPTATSSATSKDFQPFSPSLLNDLRQQGKPVFINVTADWCITCLANEKTTLSRTETKQAFKQAGINYLKADWTNRDPQITALLKQYGRTGIPLYIFYSEGNHTEGTVLPQILTVDTILETIATTSNP